MLFWYHNSSTGEWHFKDDRDGRKLAAICAEVVWEYRHEPSRSGLQSFLQKRGIDPLPDRAFAFEESA